MEKYIWEKEIGNIISVRHASFVAQSALHRHADSCSGPVARPVRWVFIVILIFRKNAHISPINSTHSNSFQLTAIFSYFFSY